MNTNTASSTPQSKFYIVKLDERNGEYEYHHILRLMLDASKNPEDELRNLASTWYEGDTREDEGHFYFHFDGVCVTPVEIREIDEQLFRALSTIIN